MIMFFLSEEHLLNSLGENIHSALAQAIVSNNCEIVNFMFFLPAIFDSKVN